MKDLKKHMTEAIKEVKELPEEQRNKEALQAALDKMTPFRVQAIISMNKHWARTKGVTLNDLIANPEKTTWTCRVTAKHPITNEIGIINVEFENFDQLTEDETFDMLGKAVHQMHTFREEKRLIKNDQLITIG